MERRPGGVWKNDGSGWVAPTGIDSRGATFKSDQNANLAHVTKKYGRFMKGDYIAHHIWDELYKALNALVWTKKALTWTNAHNGVSGEPNRWLYSETGGGGDFLAEPLQKFYWNNADEGAVYWAEKRWNELGGPSPSGGTLNSIAPHCTYAGVCTPDVRTSQYTYSANLDRAWAYGTIGSSAVSNLMAHSLDWYVYMGIDSDNPVASTNEPTLAEFDNNGDDDGGSFQYRKWTKYDSSGPSNTTQYISNACGNQNFGLPDRCTEPPQSSGVTTSVRGYYALDGCAIIKWDVTNGFKYYA